MEALRAETFRQLFELIQQPWENKGFRIHDPSEHLKVPLIGLTVSPNWRAAEDTTVHTTCTSQHYCVFETCICWTYLKKIKALLYKLSSNKGQSLAAADVNKWFNSTLLIGLLHYLHFSAHLVSIIISLSVKAAAWSQHIKSLSAACRLLSHWSSSFIWLQCDVVAWQQRAKQRQRERERRSSRELGSRLEWEQGDKARKST